MVLVPLDLLDKLVPLKYLHWLEVPHQQVDQVAPVTTMRVVKRTKMKMLSMEMKISLQLKQHPPILETSKKMQWEKMGSNIIQKGRTFA